MRNNEAIRKNFPAIIQLYVTEYQNPGLTKLKWMFVFQEHSHDDSKIRIFPEHSPALFEAFKEYGFLSLTDSFKQELSEKAEEIISKQLNTTPQSLLWLAAKKVPFKKNMPSEIKNIITAARVFKNL